MEDEIGIIYDLREEDPQEYLWRNNGRKSPSVLDQWA